MRELPGVGAAALAYNHPLEAQWIGGASVDPAAGDGPSPDSSAWFRAVSEGHSAPSESLRRRTRLRRPGTTRNTPGSPSSNEVFGAAATSAADGPRPRAPGGRSRAVVGRRPSDRFEIVEVVRNVRFLGLEKGCRAGLTCRSASFRSEDMKLVVRGTEGAAAVIPRSGGFSMTSTRLWRWRTSTMRRVYNGASAPSRLNMRWTAPVRCRGPRNSPRSASTGCSPDLITLRTRRLESVSLSACPGQVVSVRRWARRRRLAGGGAVLGLAGALAAGLLLRSLLFGVTHDGRGLLHRRACAAAAWWLWPRAACPARRAAGISPMEGLRND